MEYANKLCLTRTGNSVSCLFLRAFPGICTYDTLCSYCIMCMISSEYRLNGVSNGSQKTVYEV